MQVTLCSPKHLLQIILQDTLLSEENFLGIHPSHSPLLKSRLQTQKGLLKRIHKNSQLTYLSAVPHQICVYTNVCAAKVSDILAVQLSGYTSDYACSPIPAGLVAGLLDHIEIQATPSGYLEFRIGDGAIAHWLNCLTQPITALFVSADSHALRASSQSQITEHPHRNLFPIQHAHARCCSLLRLAAQQQIIGLSLPEKPCQWQWMQPNLISWLTIDQSLCTKEVSERQLINHCFAVLDELPWQGDTSHHNIQPPPLHRDRIINLAQNLAQAFHAMHQQCQIWGDLQEEGRDRLTAHFALILVAQRLLYGLLQIGLDVIAPEKL